MKITTTRVTSIAVIKVINSEMNKQKASVRSIYPELFWNKTNFSLKYIE